MNIEVVDLDKRAAMNAAELMMTWRKMAVKAANLESTFLTEADAIKKDWHSKGHDLEEIAKEMELSHE